MVMPLYDDNPFRRDRMPWATWSLIALCGVVFAWQVGAGTEGMRLIDIRLGAIPAAILRDHGVGSSAPVFATELTLVTYMFLHGDIFHLLGNMLFLWVFGDNIEDALGSLRFVAFYLLCGVAGGLAFAVSDPHSTIPLIGASGAVAGVIAAYLMIRPCAKVTALLLGRIPVRLAAYWILGTWLVVQVVNIAAHDKSEVAWWTHIGGFGAGVLLVLVLRRPGVKLFECMRTDNRDGGSWPMQPPHPDIPAR